MFIILSDLMTMGINCTRPVVLNITGAKLSSDNGNPLQIKLPEL